MSEAQTKENIQIKRVNPRYIAIDENIHATLSLSSLSLYMVMRWEADYELEQADIRRSAKFLYTRAKISRSQYYLSLNELEAHGLISRSIENTLGEKCTFHVSRHLGTFNSEINRGVHHIDTPVQDMDTYQYSLQDLNNTTSNSQDLTPQTPVSREKPSKPVVVKPRELIEIYREEFPNNPQTHKTLISTSLEKVLKTLIKRWPEIDPEGKPLTLYAFRMYMSFLKSNAPKFSLGEYWTQAGNRKKNGLETFARWNTVVKFLEGQYS